jgi:hypothetical protein
MSGPDGSAAATPTLTRVPIEQRFDRALDAALDSESITDAIRHTAHLAAR